MQGEPYFLKNMKEGDRIRIGYPLNGNKFKLITKDLEDHTELIGLNATFKSISGYDEDAQDFIVYVDLEFEEVPVKVNFYFLESEMMDHPQNMLLDQRTKNKTI